MPHQPLIEYFNKIIPLDEHEKSLVSELFEPNEYRYHDFVLKTGDVCRYFTFVVEGCLRLYLPDSKGNIHILAFGVENWIILDAKSFREQTPSQMNIDALEKTTVLQITRENLYQLYQQAPKFNYIVRELLERNVIALQQRLLQNMSATAQERYESFIKMYPQLPQRISHAQIAHYLGVSPEFLSRLRTKMTKRE